MAASAVSNSENSVLSHISQATMMIFNRRRRRCSKSTSLSPPVGSKQALGRVLSAQSPESFSLGSRCYNGLLCFTFAGTYLVTAVGSSAGKVGNWQLAAEPVLDHPSEVPSTEVQARSEGANSSEI